MPGAAAVNVGERRGGVTRTAIGLSILAHLALLYWIYQWGPPQVRAVVNERIIPIFLTPRPVPPPAPPEKVEPRTAPRTATDAGGRSGQGMNTPAVPVRQPERVIEPERVIPLPVVRNPDPDASTLVSNAGRSQAQGDGAGTRPGTGPGEGTGAGPGVGPGTAPGGQVGAERWALKWRQLPTQEQMNAVFPKDAWTKGISGGATLECTVMVTGRVRDCVVKIEAPPGQGFGAAALSLSRYFRVTPKRVNGKPVEARANIPYMMLIDKDAKPLKPRGPVFPDPHLPSGPIEAPPPRR